MPINKNIWLPEEGQGYREFMLKYEVVSLRIAYLYGSVHTLLFLVIDYWRATEYVYVVVWRGIMLVTLLLATLVTYRTRLSVRGYDFLAMLSGGIVAGSSFFMDFTSGIPGFFLPNFLCLLLYVFNAGLGYSLRAKMIQSFVLVTVFVLYAGYLSPNTEQLSQSLNVTINALISVLIGFLIERYKRLNFKQRNKIESLNNFKTKLISVLSHDLRSPIENLRGLLQLKESNAIRAEEMDQYAVTVRKSLENATAMLQNIVKWSGSQLNGFKPNREKINVCRIVKEVISLVESAASQKRIEIINQVKDEVYLTADEEILKIIIRNFLTNSIKFSHPDSSILISYKSDTTSCQISIEDKGVGMSPENLKNLFQLRKDRGVGTQNEHGSGIGLAITKEFVEMMDGVISVESQLGKGSTFSVTFLTKEEGVSEHK